MSLIDRFADAFAVWAEARPYLRAMLDETEMRLVVALGEAAAPLDARAVAARLGLPEADAAALLEGAYRREIVNREGGGYTPATFYAFLDAFAKYDPRWDAFPEADRLALDRSYLDQFIARHRDNVARKMQGLEAENALPNDTVMLLGEIEQMIAAAEVIAVQPCDCRRLHQACAKPVETCIWFDDGARAALDRGQGRALTHEEAVALVRHADRKGLMHTADSAWQERGLHAICNCCGDDCYPFRAAHELGSKGVWPRSRYVAAFDAEECRHCGACVRRCHFDAFTFTGEQVTVNGKLKAEVAFEPAHCWGCGLCANTCTEHAIQMVPLAGVSPAR